MSKKLLILLQSLSAGGAERQTIQLINELDTSKFLITLRYLDNRDVLLDEISRSQLESVECLHRKGRFDFSLPRKIKKLIARQKHDIVVCVSPYPMLYGLLAKLFAGAKYKLVTVIHHTRRRPGRKENFKAKLFKTVLNRCDLIIFVCKNQMDYWVETQNADPDKCVYVYNGIDANHFAVSPGDNEAADIEAKFNIARGDFVLGNVAGFRTEKKQEDIVRAVQILRESGYPIKLLLVGDGPRRPMVETVVQNCGLREDVFFAGLQKDVRPYLRLMDCFVISSNQETFSLAALEAMAAGKPLLMTDVGGAAEMLENGVNGYLFSPGAVDDLVEHVSNLIDRGLIEEMGKNSRRIVTERFTLQKMVREYEAVLSDL
jgi:glycosyltransferase involved in cell wall biosynthesis